MLKLLPLRVAFRTMYKVSPVLTQFPIQDPGIMYKVNPIQTIAGPGNSGNAGNTDMDTLAIEQDKLFDDLNALSNRVNTVLSVLAKSGAPKSNHGVKFVESNAPLDIVVNINPKQGLPKGLVGLHKKLASRFSVSTKVFVHSSATGFACDLFSNSAPSGRGTRSSYQIIFTVIFTTSVPETTCYAGNAKLAGCGTVARFVGRLLDIYPVEGKDEAAVEEWIEIADIIADPETNKKERMVQAKAFGTRLGKNKFVCGNSATIADFAMYSAIQTVEAKTYSDSVKAFCSAMEKL